ncbi:MAG: site-specific integrase [Alkaliphilus sp.]|nr:site-specific integrase [Alkaliphilus sp.]
MQGHLRRRGKKGTLYLIVDLPSEPGKRRQKWISLKTADKNIAREKAKRELAKINLGLYTEPTKVTFGQCIDSWLEDCKKRGLATRTLEDYAVTAKNHVYPPLGGIPLHQVTSRKVKTLLATKQKQSPFVARKTYVLINSVFKYAKYEEITDKNPCNDVKPPVTPDTSQPVWSLEQAVKFLRVIRNHYRHYYGLFLCALTTGMRIGEVLGLRWSDIDLQGRKIYPRQKLIRAGKNPMIENRLKTKASKQPLLMTGILAAELKRKLPERENIAQVYDHDLIFTNTVGGTVHVSNLRSRIFIPAARKAKVPVIRIHNLRHSAATLLLAAGVPIELIKRYLRHAHLATTSNFYVHDDDTAFLEEATEKMNTMFSNLLANEDFEEEK